MHPGRHLVANVCSTSGWSLIVIISTLVLMELWVVGDISHDSHRACRIEPDIELDDLRLWGRPKYIHAVDAAEDLRIMIEIVVTSTSYTVAMQAL